MDATSALGSLTHRGEDWWGRADHGLSGQFNLPTQARLHGWHRVVTASDALVQPAPPIGARLFMHRDTAGAVPYTGLMAVMGVKPRRGRSTDITAMEVTSEEVALLASREKTYRSRIELAENVDGIPETLNINGETKRVALLFFEPLPRGVHAARVGARLVANQALGSLVEGKAGFAMSSEYMQLMSTAAQESLRSSVKGDEGLDNWDPMPEINALVEDLPKVDIRLEKISRPLLERLFRSGAPADMLRYALAIQTDDGQRENTIKVGLDEYSVGAAYDLRRRLEIETPALDALAAEFQREQAAAVPAGGSLAG